MTLFWWGVGVAVLWLLLAIIVGTVRLWSDVRHSVHDVMDTMVTVSQRETKILEQLLLLPLRTLRHATQQLEQRVGVLEQNVSLLLGGVRQGGVLAIVLSLTAGYIGIAKEVGVAKQASGVLLGTAVGFTIAAFLVNDLLTSLHLRLSILKRAVVLRQEIADPPS
ncbi:hypothetical protein [Deinococcus aetherius]|uniref:hypothetical protein n=1 Tax=Deinococcus aetherius TaxID=200252 RepID=UPI0022303AE2|nr:hypothetical protein [Deinococcus aetherius]